MLHLLVFAVVASPGSGQHLPPHLPQSTLRGVVTNEAVRPVVGVFDLGYALTDEASSAVERSISARGAGVVRGELYALLSDPKCFAAAHLALLNCGLEHPRHTKDIHYWHRADAEGRVDRGERRVICGLEWTRRPPGGESIFLPDKGQQGQRLRRLWQDYWSGKRDCFCIPPPDGWVTPAAACPGTGIQD